MWYMQRTFQIYPYNNWWDKQAIVGWNRNKAVEYIGINVGNIIIDGKQLH